MMVCRISLRSWFHLRAGVSALVICAVVACTPELDEPSAPSSPAVATPVAAPASPTPQPVEVPEPAPRIEAAESEPDSIALQEVADDGSSLERVVVGELSRFWTTCDPAVLARVQRHRVLEGDDAPRIEDRLAEGWVPRAVDFLVDDDEFAGAWGCRGADGGRVEVAYVTRVYALGVGPRFFYDANEDAVTAANWLGRVLLSEDPLAAMRDRQSRASALRRLAACQAPNGVPLTSGLFIAAQRLGRFGRAEAFYGWFVLPDTIVDGEVRDVVALQRRGSAGPVAVSFELDGDRCVPLDDGAIGAYQIAASIRRTEPALRIDGVSADMNSADAVDNASRAFIYVLRQTEPLRVVEDFLAFYATNRPYESSGWRSLGPGADGRFLVMHDFTVGRDEYQLAWSVNTRTGDVTLASALTELIAVVLPNETTVRVVNAGDVVELTSAEGSGAGYGEETLSSEVIDERLAERQAEVIACYRYELARNRRPAGVQAAWKVTGEGRAVDVQITIDGVRSISFEQCFERFITGTRFPTFDGPPVDAQTAFTFDRVD